MNHRWIRQLAQPLRRRSAERREQLAALRWDDEERLKRWAEAGPGDVVGASHPAISALARRVLELEARQFGSRI